VAEQGPGDFLATPDVGLSCMEVCGPQVPAAGIGAGLLRGQRRAAAGAAAAEVGIGRAASVKPAAGG
jgi:hypothetical protein